MNTILNSLSEADKNKSFLTIYKDGADFDIKLSDFASAISTGSLKLLNGISLSASLTEVTDGIGTISPLQLSTEAVGLSRTVNLSAGATNPRLFNVAYTINNSGAQTGTLTGIFLNATETALNGITHNLMDLQVGGVSKFKVSSSGTGTYSFIGGNLSLNNGYIQSSQLYAITFGKIGNFFIDSASDGVVRITDNATTSFNRIQLGGTTSSFPSIKRNGAAIDFRLADDSGYAGLSCAALSTTGISSFANGQLYVGSNFTTTYRLNVGAFGSPVASAELEVTSTTKGFLPPRMTTAQINAIATPAEGLQVYNTTINHMCFYMGGAWVKINHSPM